MSAVRCASGDADTTALETKLATAESELATVTSQRDETISTRDKLRADMAVLREDLASSRKRVKALNEELASLESGSAAAAGTAAEAEPATASDASSNSTKAPAHDSGPIAPSPVDWSADLGPYQVSGASVGRADDGTFEVVATLTNTGAEVDAVYLSATLLKGGKVVGAADGAVSFRFGEFNAGETEAATFVSTDSYVADVDQVVLEIAFTNNDG